ncbi:MAG: carbohydrate-binding family 9-like protein [Candidatus Delongbacteria bacterium]|nr:carbohydrate-binding family 9-like protein [Candidatus Delongbacteria bacterium]MBN2836112.1 carbohydrate-binding family 9-like protein [Candidatus Delongbacteria bacterium]
MKKIVSLLLFTVLCIWAFDKPKTKFDPEKYVVYKTEKPILMDGKVDDSVWLEVPWTNNFVDIEGELKPLPHFKTRVKMLYDDSYFYFAAELEEPHIWAKLKERDSVIYYDNDFEIFIDPDGDTFNYYELEVNAFATEWDLLLTAPYRDRGCHAIDSWDIAGLITKVHHYGTINNPSDLDEKWSVEIAIPWKVLEEAANHGGIPHNGEQWRINFSRVQWDTEVVNGEYVKKLDENGKSLPERNWVWSPQGLIAMHCPERWGFVQFSENSPNNPTKFVDDKNEDIKQQLRKLYYLQRDYKDSFNNYTGDIEKFVKQIQIDNPNFNPDFFMMDKYWIAKQKGSDGKVWFISDDGRIWSD